MKSRRQDESRTQVHGAMMFALGSYMEQESKKVDQWRDQGIGQLYAHLSHELEEIRANIKDDDLTWLVHNAADATSLAAILLAKALEMTGTKIA